MIALDYFRKSITDTEVDSMILLDETELSMAKPASESVLIKQKQGDVYLSATLSQKLCAYLILFAKYTNAKSAIVSYVTEQSCYPIYAEVSGSEQSSSLTARIEKWIRDVSELEDIGSFDINQLMKQLELQPMPFLYGEASLFEKAVVGRDGMKLAILLQDDVIAFKYDTGCFLPGTIDRVMRAYSGVLKGVLENRTIASISMIDEKMEEELDRFFDNTVSYDAGLSVVDLLEKAIAEYPERTARCI